MMTFRTVVRSLIALLAGVVLSAATDVSPFPRELKNVEQATEGQVLTMGSIRFLKDGEDKKCGQIGIECLLIVLPPTGHRAMVYGFKRTGDFAWSLPPGEYTILGFEWRDSGRNVIGLRVTFAVPQNAKAVYIGDLLLAVSKKGPSSSGFRDAYDEFLPKFESDHPELAGSLVDAVVRKDEALAASGDITFICAEEWKLACAKSASGVTPTLPSDGKGFDVVNDLRPMFRWNASADPEVTYDFALFEAASYSEDGILHQITKGRLAGYKAGLTEPAWQPEQPLEPDRKYYWSVRLRHGEDVSTWSSYSYFNFFLIGFSSGYGQWFRFATPPR